jgi:hypothetical protein
MSNATRSSCLINDPILTEERAARAKELDAIAHAIFCCSEKLGVPAGVADVLACCTRRLRAAADEIRSIASKR